ncbi:phosphotransferase family protein [Candidatus Poriferisocius sp.]|uniref:phosphotransferase family protein n=1 Tax=Candidatus Poriferisocius sp. TaxID=3101276 RepID=UPI003B01BBAE
MTAQSATLARLADLVRAGTAIEVTGVASAGAARRTLFVNLVVDGATIPAVAQIVLDRSSHLGSSAEAALLQTAARAGVPVPEVLAYDDDSGSLLTRLVEGASIPRRVLRLAEADPRLGQKLTDDCASALAAVHSIEARALPDLPKCQNPHEFVDQLEESLDSIRPPIPTFRLGLSWLRRHAPEPVRNETLVHGDFRNGNLLVTEEGLAAVLDWELAHTGDPMEDIAWLCLRFWRFGNDALEIGGFGEIESFHDAYDRAGGHWDDERLRWWSVARTVWWGLGLASQAQAFLGGLTDSIVFAASGRRVVELEFDMLNLIANDHGPPV